MSGFNGSQAPGGNGFNGQFTGPSSEGGMQSAGDHQKSTLWMGELEPWMDENFVAGVFRSLTNEQVQVKVIRDKASGNAGYCFVEFPSHEAATSALHNLQGQSIPNSSRTFKLNWASGGGINDRRDDRAPEYSIFVGDLEPSINEYVLVSLFNSKYPSCKSAKIMTDNQSGQSRGYGFVRFSSEADQQRALVEMQGVYCGSRPMRISVATPKNRNHFHGGNHGGMVPPHMHPGAQQQMWASPMGPAPYQQQFAPPHFGLQMNQFTDPNNTTVFVGGLSGYVTEDELRSFFQGFGEITYVKIPPGKGCGFVQFVHRHAAEMAINQMQGYPIGNSRVRLSWGRSQNNSGIGTPYRPAPPPPHYAPGNHNGPHGAGAPYPPGPGPNAQFQGPNMPGPYAGGPGQAPQFGPQGHHAGQSQSPSLQQGGGGGPGAQGFGGPAAGQVSTAQQ